MAATATAQHIWTKTNLLRDVLAAMLTAEKPVCKYEGNGVQVLLTEAALVTYELDDRDTRNPAWVPTERAVFTAAEDELDRRNDWFGEVQYQIKRWRQVEEGDDWEAEAYLSSRRGRIEDAYTLLLAKARGGIRPLSATPTVSVAEAAGF